MIFPPFKLDRYQEGRRVTDKVYAPANFRTVLENQALLCRAICFKQLHIELHIIFENVDVCPLIDLMGASRFAVKAPHASEAVHAVGGADIAEIAGIGAAQQQGGQSW